jgi:hypothetical protein
MSTQQKAPSKADLIQGIHYYINEQGYWVFTETYHRLRGYCCKQKCKHCPYGNAPEPLTNRAQP